MDAFLRWLLASAPAPLRPVIAIVVGGLRKVWEWSEILARRLAGKWFDVLGAARRLATGFARLADTVWRLTTHLYTRFIPDFVWWGVQLAVRWAGDRLRNLETLARNAVDAVRRWVSALVDAVRARVEAVFRWALDRVREIRQVIDAILRSGFPIPPWPQRVVAWLIGLIWREWWRYAWSLRDRIVDVLWRQLVTVMVRGAREVERQIGRLL